MRRKERDRRYDLRVATSFPVAMVSATGKRVRRVQNVSYGGMQVRLGLEELDAGERVELTFRLPEGGGLICCAGKVVYQWEDLTGIRFTELPLSQQVALDKYITTQVGDLWYLGSK